MIRRALLGSVSVAALAVSGVLAACTVSTGTASLDLTKLQALVSTATTFTVAALGIPEVSDNLGAAVVADIKSTIANATTMLTSLQVAYPGVVSVSFKSGTVLQDAQSILADLQKIEPLIAAVLAVVGAAVPGLGAAFAAYQIVVAAVQALIATATVAVGAGAPRSDFNTIGAISTINSFAVARAGMR